MRNNLTTSGDHKIRREHQDRLAIVYVRQSTVHQVQHHQESTKLQYGLVEQAQKLGWRQEQIVVIDDDLGLSGASADGRQGFQRMLSEIALNHVGLILGVEMSRLARSCKDWYQLLELCSLFRTLIADLDGMYDPTSYNDRLLLGLKGTMARRGELVTKVPIGYVRSTVGEVQLDPDEEVQSFVKLVSSSSSGSAPPAAFSAGWSNTKCECRCALIPVRRRARSNGVGPITARCVTC